MRQCKDCKKEITSQATRCKPCFNKFHGFFREWNKTHKGYNSGSKNGMWKGDKAGYGALHEYLVSHNPKPTLCVRCNSRPPYDLANISGNYTRDIDDYEWLCRKCHMEKDGRLVRLHRKCTQPTQRQLLAWVYRYFGKTTWKEVTPIKEVAARMGIKEVTVLQLLQRLRECWPGLAPKKNSRKSEFVFDETRDSEPRIQF